MRTKPLMGAGALLLSSSDQTVGTGGRFTSALRYLIFGACIVSSIINASFYAKYGFPGQGASIDEIYFLIFGTTILLISLNYPPKKIITDLKYYFATFLILTFVVWSNLFWVSRLIFFYPPEMLSPGSIFVWILILSSFSCFYVASRPSTKTKIWLVLSATAMVAALAVFPVFMNPEIRFERAVDISGGLLSAIASVGSVLAVAVFSSEQTAKISRQTLEAQERDKADREHAALVWLYWLFEPILRNLASRDTILSNCLSVIDSINCIKYNDHSEWVREVRAVSRKSLTPELLRSRISNFDQMKEIFSELSYDIPVKYHLPHEASKFLLSVIRSEDVKICIDKKDAINTIANDLIQITAPPEEDFKTKNELLRAMTVGWRDVGRLLFEIRFQLNTFQEKFGFDIPRYEPNLEAWITKYGSPEAAKSAATGT